MWDGGGGGQGHQTNTATLIYCFTAQWSHCFDDYCARRPHYSDYDEEMLPQYLYGARQDQTFRRLLIQTSECTLGLRANFLRNLVHPSLTFPVEYIIGATWSNTPSMVYCTYSWSFRVPRPHLETFFVVCAFAICSQPPSRCPW